MRQPVTTARVEDFMRALGKGVSVPTRVFLVGGASAVLLGWRDSTIDIDLIENLKKMLPGYYRPQAVTVGELALR